MIPITNFAIIIASLKVNFMENIMWSPGIEISNSQKKYSIPKYRVRTLSIGIDIFFYLYRPPILGELTG